MTIPVGATTLIIFLMLAFFAGAYLPWRYGLTQMWEAVPLMRVMHALLLTIQEKEVTLSKELDDTLARLDTKADQVIELLNTDTESLAALQRANDALQAQIGDGPEVKAAQAIIDKLTAATTPPAAPTGDAPPTTGDAPPTTGDAPPTDPTIPPNEPPADPAPIGGDTSPATPDTSASPESAQSGA